MSQNRNPSGGGCCGAPIKGLRRLTFPDGTQVGITGLDSVMENLYREGRLADARTAADILEQLKSENYFAPSARQEYEELFLKEYQRFLAVKSESIEKEKNATASSEESQKANKKGLLSLFKGGKKGDGRGGRRNIKIVPGE